MTAEQLANLKAFAEAQDAQFDREVVLELIGEIEKKDARIDQLEEDNLRYRMGVEILSNKIAFISKVCDEGIRLAACLKGKGVER